VVITPEKAQLIAHLMADGFVSKGKPYEIMYANVNKGLVEEVRALFEKVYGISPDIKCKGKRKPLWYIKIRKKWVWRDLMRYSSSYYSREWRVPEEVLRSKDPNVKLAFLRAFIKDDGSKDRDIIYIYSVNLEGLKQLEQLAKDLGLVTKLVASDKLHTLKIYRKLSTAQEMLIREKLLKSICYGLLKRTITLEEAKRHLRKLDTYIAIHKVADRFDELL